MGRVELLAPAGDMECFRAAIYAGADAVYMAGKSFGARASANNFTEEEFVEALNIAHIHGRRIFLTLNTLIKEKEWDSVYDFLKPLYEAGLDGVIIQDMGLIDYLSKAFPKLELHASTQMTITHKSSAELLKSRGICRIVPARELSLEEIRELKRSTGLEIECFIHGALCYCYSGQCLFSSYLGGRSGNRGRCAGPCRLPYSVNCNGKPVANNEYPLSLKDLCTIDHIAELIEAGIDSFKIEGRMKSPEYVYGVTSLYRKYIDAYYEGRSTKVSDEDHHILESLYLRSSVGSGYYYTHNGRKMITLSDPSYNNRDESVINSVHSKMNEDRALIHLQALCYAYVGEKILLTVWDNKDNTVVVSGDIVDEASNRAATEEDIVSRLSKTGGTEFVFDNISVDMDDNCFIPVKVLNELRRQAIDAYMSQVLDDYRRMANPKPEAVKTSKTSADGIAASFQATIMKPEQLDSLSGYNLGNIYIPYDLIYLGKINKDVLDDFKKDNPDTVLGIALPRIIRSRDEEYLISLMEYLSKNSDMPVLVRNLEELALLRKNGCKNIINGDYFIYSWNTQSKHFYDELLSGLTAPVELSLHELRDLDDKSLVIPVYGYVPLMVASNCLAKTYNDCRGNINDFAYSLTDRRGKNECTYSNCVHCYNEIYNAVPTSLHNKMNDIKRAGFNNFRFDFTKEKDDEIKSVLDIFIGGNTNVDYEFTTGHFEKGAI